MSSPTRATTVFATEPDGTVDPAAMEKTITRIIRRMRYLRVRICRMNGKFCARVTINYGARFDEYSSSTDNENQISPRINLIYQPTDITTLHAGYSRYFTPPPLETVPAGDITAFNGTTGQAGITTEIGSGQIREMRIITTLGISQKDHARIASRPGRLLQDRPAATR